MLLSKNIANDHSKNGHSVAKSQEREKEGSDLIKAVKETAGESNHLQGYSLDILTNFFRKNYDFEKYVYSTNENDRIQVTELFVRVTDCTSNYGMCVDFESEIFQLIAKYFPDYGEVKHNIAEITSKDFEGRDYRKGFWIGMNATTKMVHVNF
jgi:hypothetical protein